MDIRAADILYIVVCGIAPSPIGIDRQRAAFGINGHTINGINHRRDSSPAAFGRIGDGYDRGPFTVGAHSIIVGQQIACHRAVGCATGLLNTVFTIVPRGWYIINDIHFQRRRRLRAVIIRHCYRERDIVDHIFRGCRWMIQIVLQIKGPAIAIRRIAGQRHGEDRNRSRHRGDGLTIGGIGQRHAAGLQSHIGQFGWNRQGNTTDSILSAINRQRTGNGAAAGSIAANRRITLSSGEVIFIHEGAVDVHIRVATGRWVDGNRRLIIADADRLIRRRRIAIPINNGVAEIIIQRGTTCRGMVGIFIGCIGPGSIGLNIQLSILRIDG